MFGRRGNLRAWVWVVGLTVAASWLFSLVRLPSPVLFGALVAGTDRLSAYLATTPGRLFAVLATAADSGSDVTYVLALQVVRVFAMLLLAPLLGRYFSRGRTRCPPGRP